MTERVHGGIAVARALKALGVEHLFTLTGGHIFPILDGCHQEGIRIVDTRHEQSAAFAAEGWGRLTRTLGVVAITAGPGVTNAMSAFAQARFNHAPVLALGGRAPEHRWGQGSLQEIDHVPFVDPIAPARTIKEPASIQSGVFEAAHAALLPPRGPHFVDFPLDLFFTMVDAPSAAPDLLSTASPDQGDVDKVCELLEGATRPIVVAGSNVYLDRAEGGLIRLAEAAEAPIFVNGQGRGCVPADHRLAFARSRSKAMKEADLVVVAGTPLDFRLGFGQGFAEGTKIVHVDSHPSGIARHVALAASVVGPLDQTLEGIAAGIEKSADSKEWLETLRRVEEEKRESAQAELHSTATPIHPMRIYGELVPLLERDAIVVGDGGDFV
ncbi:MAG: thiamine pyrophosphate-binding protein, partial [Actinomycetota bacterium]